MADQTSTLSVEVRTGQSVVELDKLKASLASVATTAATVNNTAVVAPTVAKDAKAATASINQYSSAMDMLEKSSTSSAATQLRVSRSMGQVRGAAKLEQGATLAQVKEFNQKMDATEFAAEARRVNQMKGNQAKYLQSLKEVDSARLAQAKAANLSFMQAEQTGRAAELAALRADIVSRSQTQLTLEKASQAQMLAARKSAIAQLTELDKSKYNKGAIASKSLFAEMLRQEEAQDKVAFAKLAATRTAIIKSLTATTGAPKASQTLFADIMRQQDMAGSAMTMQRMASMTAPSGMYSAKSSSLAAMLRQEDADAKALAKTQTTLARERDKLAKATAKGTSVLRDNAAAMRDGHAASRGLAGSLGTLWMTYGAIAPLMAGAAVGATLKASYSAGSELEYRLRYIEALGNEAVKVKNLMPAVMNSMFKPVEVAEGLRQLTQAGLTTSQGLAALQPTLQLATMGEMSVAEAALTATSSISAFNLAISDASRVGDVFAKAAAVSNTDVKGIAEAMKQAATSSSLYGITMEETAAQLAILAKRGIFGSAAGTAIKNFERELYAPTEKGRKALEKMGISAYDAVGKLRPFKDVIQDLVRTTSTMNDKNRSAFLKDVFNERGMRAAAILIDDYKGLLGTFDELESSQGFMARANELLIDTTQGAANRMSSVLQQSMVRAFENAEPDVRRAIQGLTELFGSDAFVNGVAKLARGVANLTSALAENWGKVTLLAGAYLTLRGLMSAGTALTALMERSERNLAKAKLGTAAATAASTAAEVTSQVATTTSAAKLGKLVTTLGTAVKWFGWAGVAVGGLTALYQIFTANTARVLSDEEARAARIRSTTSAIDAQINALREKLRLEGQSPNSQLTDTRSEVERLRDEAQAARERATAARLDATIAGVNNNVTEGGAATLQGKGQRKIQLAELRAYNLEVKAADAESEYTSKEVTRDFLQQASDISDATSKVTSAFKQNKDRIDEAWVNKGGEAVRWAGGDSILRQMETVADKAKASGSVNEIEGYIRQMKLLEGELQKVLPGQYASKGDKPKGHGRTDRNSPEGLLDSALVKAGKLSLRETGDIQKANIKVTRNLEDAQKKLNEQYLTDDVIAGLRAREKAEDAFNSILDSRVSMIEEIRKGMEGVTDPKRLRMGESRIGALSSDLASITLAKSAAGDKGEAGGTAQYLADNTASAGVDKLFTKYRNEAMKTGDVVANALETSFDRAETALETFALTGKLSFREFTVSVLQDLSKMAMKMATNQLFGMVLQMGMSAIGGAMGAGSTTWSGANGASTTYSPAQSFSVSAKGNAFSAGNMMKFAKGGAFTNNITTGTNVAPMSMFGEAGPEAIMPLTRTSDGSLGVRAVPIGAESGGGNVFHISTAVYVQSDGSARSETKGGSTDGLMSKLGDEMNAAARAVVRRELAQGGSINLAIKRA